MRKTTFKFQFSIFSNGNPPPPARVTLIFIFMLCFASTKPLSAQNVGINSTGALPKSSAILDLSTGNSGNLGVLLPKVALQASNVAAPITPPSNGLLVYDTVSAGSGADTVSQGFYYWNSTSSTWIRLGDHTSYSAIGTTDDSIKTSTPAAMKQMSITFVPVHPVVILEFSASGLTDRSSTNLEAVNFKVLVNNSTPTLTTSTTTPYILGGYGCTNIAQGDYDNFGTYEPSNGWDCRMTIPIHVIPGTSVTISIDWWAQIGTEAGGTYSIIENDVATKSEGCHRAMTITD